MVEEPAGAHSLWTLHAGLTSELEVSDGLIRTHTHSETCALPPTLQPGVNPRDCR